MVAKAQLLKNLRRFFDSHGLIEVQTPLLTEFAAIDTHIEPFGFTEKGPFLISSPEYAMKRLLARGSGSIYQISSVFRREEQGEKHNQEFTLAEFYLVNQDHWGLMDFVATMLSEVLDWPLPELVDYQALFLSELGLDPFVFTTSDFISCAKKQHLDIPAYLSASSADQTDQLDFLFSACIEPRLALNKPVFIHSYPYFMSALSRIDIDSKKSTRFELFYQGLELGNGFYELNNTAEQRSRFLAQNRKRQLLGKAQWALDEPFLASLDSLPDCAGIALGLERILMLQLGLGSIEDALTLPYRP